MDTSTANTLLHQAESETLDFKQQQYKFYEATDVDKAELLKDVLAFANTSRIGDAYILIGVKEAIGSKADVLGVTKHLKDSDIQQFVNGKTNKKVRFLCGTVAVEGAQVDYIRIDQAQDRPIFLTRDFGRLPKNVVYVRRGSSTAEANPQEIADMGAEAAKVTKEVPSLQLEFADPRTRGALGTSIQATSVRLVDPPPASSEELRRFAQLMPQLGEMHRVSRPLRAMSLTRGPSAADLRKFHEETALLTPVGFCVRNGGTRSAKDVHVEVRISGFANVKVFNRRDLPRRPRGPIEMAVRADVPIRSDISVKKYDDHWVASFGVTSLQPKATYWTEADLFVGATQSATLDLTARIFSDDVPEPPKVKMTLSIQLEERAYNKSDLER